MAYFGLNLVHFDAAGTCCSPLRTPWSCCGRVTESCGRRRRAAGRRSVTRWSTRLGEPRAAFSPLITVGRLVSLDCSFKSARWMNQEQGGSSCIPSDFERCVEVLSGRLGDLIAPDGQRVGNVHNFTSGRTLATEGGMLLASRRTCEAAVGLRVPCN